MSPEEILTAFNTAFIMAGIIAILGGFLAILSKRK